MYSDASSSQRDGTVALVRGDVSKSGVDPERVTCNKVKRQCNFTIAAFLKKNYFKQ